MIIDFHCKDKKVSCKFEEWDYYKAYLAKKTILYIKKTVEDFLSNENHLLRDYDEIGNYEDLNVILNFFSDEYIENLDLKDELQFEKFCNKSINVFKNFNDTLIYFNIGGINTILEKVSYEGNLSIGNAMDMIILLNYILQNKENEIKEDESFVIDFYELCIYSINNKEKIYFS
jgi:hypothetical protein